MYQVICGFPGVGKSEAIKEYGDRLVDLDEPGKPDYIDAIKKLIAEGKVVLVPFWQKLRDEMVEAGIHFLLVYPESRLKRNYIHRYKLRGSPEKMVSTMTEKWDDFIKSCEDQRGCDHKVLGTKDVYLTDVLRDWKFK